MRADRQSAQRAPLLEGIPFEPASVLFQTTSFVVTVTRSRERKREKVFLRILEIIVTTGRFVKLAKDVPFRPRSVRFVSAGIRRRLQVNIATNFNREHDNPFFHDPTNCRVLRRLIRDKLFQAAEKFAEFQIFPIVQRPLARNERIAITLFSGSPCAR